MQTALTPEDTLRINVLLAGSVEAIRIDESAMTLAALTDRGEARIALHPNCRSDQYLLRVRETLGGLALGSPGGYPVYLQRWTRMGQTSDRNLAALLLLGEPEAVVAVAHAPGLTDELARRVWWALPTMDIARCMLGREEVQGGAMAKVLADFLIEHLPFEQNPDAALETVRLVLRAGLADEPARAALWSMATRKPHYYLGFLESFPDHLPQTQPARSDLDAARDALLPLAGHPCAKRLLWALGAEGQTYLMALEEVLRRPLTHHIVYTALDLAGARLRELAQGEAATEAAAAAPHFAAELRALAVLAGLSEATAVPVLTRTTAVGPLMRRKLEPLLGPVLGEIAVLRGSAGG
ncbi:MAG TPA: hypothetical protein VN279_16525 [Rhodocyclaceae bacterium]|nr:hypothetical protein [Rhodocyclaceae bacterium]